METKAGDDAQSSAKSGNAFTNRRQKNLQKFRKHIAAQRHSPHVGPLDTKPSMEAAQVEDKLTRKAGPIAKDDNERGDVVETTEKPQTLPPTHERESIGTNVEGQSATLSPHVTASKRWSDMIKKNRILSQRAKRAAECPKSPESPKSTKSHIEDHNRCRRASTMQEEEGITPFSSLIMTDSNHVQQAGNFESNNAEKHEMKISKDGNDLPTREAPDICEVEELDRVNENAHCKVHDKTLSIPPEEALKPKSNNRLKARRTLHHKKFGRDQIKHREKHVARGPTSQPNQIRFGWDGARSDDLVAHQKTPTACAYSSDVHECPEEPMMTDSCQEVPPSEATRTNQNSPPVRNKQPGNPQRVEVQSKLVTQVELDTYRDKDDILTCPEEDPTARAIKHDARRKPIEDDPPNDEVPPKVLTNAEDFTEIRLPKALQPTPVDPSRGSSGPFTGKLILQEESTNMADTPTQMELRAALTGPDKGHEGLVASRATDSPELQLCYIEDEETGDKGENYGLWDGNELNVEVHITSRADKEQFNLEKDNAIPQSKIDEASKSFDLRSIHEFPPEHIIDACRLLPSQDTSWDTSKVFVTEFQQPLLSQSKGESLTFFYTGDPASVVLDKAISCKAACETTSVFGVDVSDFLEAFEGKEELDHPSLRLNLESTTQPRSTEPMDSVTSIASPRRRLSRTQIKGTSKSFGFDVSILAVESTRGVDDDIDWKGDDQNLLGYNERYGDGGDNVTWKKEANISKADRLQKYVATGDESDNSSITSSKAEEEYDSSFMSSEPVEYTIQTQGENNEEEILPLEQEEQSIQVVLDGSSAAAAQSLVLDSKGTTALGEFSSSELGPAFAVRKVDSKAPVSASDYGEAKPLIVRFAEKGENGADYISNSSSSSCSISSSSEDHNGIHNTNMTREEGEAEQNTVMTEWGSTDSLVQIPTEDDRCKEEEKVNTMVEPFDLEESASLVGESLVPSFGALSSRIGVFPSRILLKTREGIPPRCSLSPLPPPPPPPLSKKKRKKKKMPPHQNTIVVPLIAPPPAGKLKKWQDSKNWAMIHLGVVKESPLEGMECDSTKDRCGQNPSTRQKQVEDMVCGAFADAEMWDLQAESPGRIKLACGHFPEDGPWTANRGANAGQGGIRCGDFAGETGTTPRLLGGSGQDVCGISDALKMAGLHVSPRKASQCVQAGRSPSPVVAARSIALENAMRRAKKGSAGFDFPSTSIRSQIETRSLFENEIVASASIGSSICMEGYEPNTFPSQEDSNHHGGKVDEPPTLTRRDSPPIETERSAAKPIVFLHELTSPSLSISPSNDLDNYMGIRKPTQIAATSPLLHDTKMAQKAALASYAAAVTFEEQYVSSLSRDESQSADGCSFGNNDPVVYPESAMPSLFCSPELGENIQHMAGGNDAARSLPSLFFAPDLPGKHETDLAEMIEGTSGILKGLVTSSSSRDGLHEFQDLRGGAFSPWKNAMYARIASNKRADDGSVANNPVPPTSASKGTAERVVNRTAAASDRELVHILGWLTRKVLEMDMSPLHDASDEVLRFKIARVLDDDENLNRLCFYMAERVNVMIELENEERAQRNVPISPRKAMRPFHLAKRLSGHQSSSVVAANFVSFIYRLSKASGIPSPFGEDNPFLLDLVSTSINGVGSPIRTPTIKITDGNTMQKVVFSRCNAHNIARFCMQVSGELGVWEEEGESVTEVVVKTSSDHSFDLIEATRAANPSPPKKSRNQFFKAEVESIAGGDRKRTVPAEHPSPFEVVVKECPKILSTVLSFLGDPVVVCRLKMTSQSCCNFVAKNEQLLIRNAVRLGGLSMNLRPSFWLWVTLEKCGKATMPEGSVDKLGSRKRLAELEERGRTGKWSAVINRDVARAFGKMAPHKAGGRLRTDSIVRALVTWGQSRILKRGVKGGGNALPSGSHASHGDWSASDASQTPTDTVSDWGGVSPVASFTGSFGGAADGGDRTGIVSSKIEDDGRDAHGMSLHSQSEDFLALSGYLNDETKANLQRKLGFILYALAAEHEEVGYCQGMDYVVAHLLRILQGTVYWRASNGTLPASVHSAMIKVATKRHSDTDLLSHGIDEEGKGLVVEDTVFQVMDCLFTTYNLQHMYWPELRCLKTCCKVFERLIHLKLPVLADHFEHHELNVGLFALGWFQTLFLYLPSMPSATVCHMWDIWLVERSFKIFFRVGTAILFLSQPTLLNHELEGMQIYLNTFPDATLLNPDILISVALSIKITNKMLMDIEEEVSCTCDSNYY